MDAGVGLRLRLQLDLMSDTTVNGLDEGTVRLTGYSARWPGLFEREAELLRAALGDAVLAIEHIGSTAVPGMDAKPIIDIAIETPSFKDLASMVSALQEKDYVHHGEYGLPGRQFFTRGNPVKFHVHLVEKDSEHWRRWILFRDYLRANERGRQSYIGFKRMLAMQHANNRKAYTAAKKPFIDRMMQDAESWLTW
jgi:GrpB-like predicted nucleotidyltransferase (UPF0157 family)